MTFELQDNMRKAVAQADKNYQRVLNNAAAYHEALWSRASGQGLTKERLSAEIRGVGSEGQLRPMKSLTLGSFTNPGQLAQVTAVNLLSFYRAVLEKTGTLEIDAHHKGTNYEIISAQIKELFHCRLSVLSPIDILQIYWGCNKLTEAQYNEKRISICEKLNAFAEHEPNNPEQVWLPSLTRLGGQFTKFPNERLLDELESDVHLRDQFYCREYLAKTLSNLIIDCCTRLSQKSRRRSPDEVLGLIKYYIDTPYLYPFRKTIRRLLNYRKNIAQPLPDRSWFLQLAVSLKATGRQLADLLFAAGFTYDLEAEPVTAALELFLDNPVDRCERGGYKSAGISGKIICVYQPAPEYHIELETLCQLLNSCCKKQTEIAKAFPFLPGINGSEWEPVYGLLAACCGKTEKNEDGSFCMDFDWSGPIPKLQCFFEFQHEDMIGYGETARLLALLNNAAGQTACNHVKLPAPGSEEQRDMAEKVREHLMSLPEEQPGAPDALCGERIDLDFQEKGILMFSALVQICTTGHFPAVRIWKRGQIWDAKNRVNCDSFRSFTELAEEFCMAWRME